MKNVPETTIIPLKNVPEIAIIPLKKCSVLPYLTKMHYFMAKHHFPIN